ncbi:interleukin-6-like [Plectropomus leopardus]|uniref:interleukin-6-like n=1 Tax=Plectropomus leopardus TaxID=160734 RepID=UPI001C4BDABD|nr:interleukin-6-like [Plectropomus leopardus]
MPSTLNAYLLSAVMLAALLLCAPGAPLEDAPTESPAGDPSGEEELDSSDLLSNLEVWDKILPTTKRHEQQFEDEFQNEVKYHFLDHYKISSLPAYCPPSNFSKEACLHRFVSGLLTYSVLLMHVEKEYPGSLICSEVRRFSVILINQIKEKMKNPERVTAVTSSQEAQLLKALENPNTFHRKMTAHSILQQLHYFLLHGKRQIAKRERTRGSSVFRTMEPVSFYQTLKR